MGKQYGMRFTDRFVDDITREDSKGKKGKSNSTYRRVWHTTSKYIPHQGKKECERRILRGVI